MAYMEIDVDDHLDEASATSLRDEINRRIARGTWEPDEPNPLNRDVHPWTRRGMADDIRQAFYARNASRLEMLLSEVEKRECAA